VFKHRSRWSHGLLFGTLFRVVYFSGVVTLLCAAVLIAYSFVFGGDLPGTIEIAEVWRKVGSVTRDNSGLLPVIAALGGMWLGAASHTVTDITASYVKTGRIGEFL
jgi:uncharacterized metal-binding protein